MGLTSCRKITITRNASRPAVRGIGIATVAAPVLRAGASKAAYDPRPRRKPASGSNLVLPR